ncbi:MAG: mechanosensitive ion channel family protein [Akkermansiaceae bacterium]
MKNNDMNTIADLNLNAFTQSSFFQNVISYTPKLLAAALILLIGWLAATILAKLTKSLFLKIGIDSFHKKNQAELPDDEFLNNLTFSSILSKFVYWGVMLATLVATVETLGLSKLSAIFDQLLDYLPRLVSGIILLVIFFIIAGILKNTLRKKLRGLGLSYANFIGNSVYWLLIVVGFSMSLNHLQIETSLVSRIILVIMLSLCLTISIALGFSMKEISTKIIYSHYARDVFTIGTEIQINGESVTVVNVKATTTIVETIDGRRKFIPNSELMNTILEE